MLKQACVLCKVVGIFAVVGLINLGIEGLTQVNYLERFLGEATTITRILYGVMGLSGLAFLASYFMVCPGCCKK